MSLPALLEQRLRLPVVAAPMFLISNPQLVLACCRNGVVGSFPALNQRESSGFKAGLEEIVEAVAPQPVLGIGGLDMSSMPLLAASGATGMAAVGAFVPNAGDDITEFVQKRINGLRLAFDSASRRT